MFHVKVLINGWIFCATFYFREVVDKFIKSFKDSSAAEGPPLLVFSANVSHVFKSAGSFFFGGA